MSKEYIYSEKAPAPVGPYSQAVKVGGFVYIAGQGGLDPESGAMVEGGVVAQADQTMKNLQAILEAAGTSLDSVVKTNIYLRYIKDFAAVNEVYSSFMAEPYPARSTIAASALPVKALVEIEMVAVVPAGKQKAVEKPKAKKKPADKKAKKAKKPKKGKKKEGKKANKK